MTTTHEVPTSPAITWGHRRKSSLRQSYERQTKALHDLGIPEGRVFEDAMSGKTVNRLGRQNLLSHVRANDEVWVDGLDRLGRSTLATLQAMEELEQRVRVCSAKPGEDLQGATGELMRQLMLAMAQWERRQMLERVAGARAARTAAGLPAGRPKTALGEKQVRHVHALRSAGYSVRQIVADLGVSRASVYRALNLLEMAERETVRRGAAGLTHVCRPPRPVTIVCGARFGRPFVTRPERGQNLRPAGSCRRPVDCGHGFGRSAGWLSGVGGWLALG